MIAYLSLPPSLPKGGDDPIEKTSLLDLQLYHLQLTQERDGLAMSAL